MIMIGCWHDDDVCLYVCPCVTLCIVAKRYNTSYSKSVWRSELEVSPIEEHDFTTFNPLHRP